MKRKQWMFVRREDDTIEQVQTDRQLTADEEAEQDALFEELFEGHIDDMAEAEGW